MIVNPVGLASLLPVATSPPRATASDHRAATHDPATCPVCARESRAQEHAGSVGDTGAEASEAGAHSSRISAPVASTGVVWTTAPGFAAAASPDPLGALPVTRRQRQEAQRRVARAYDTEPPSDFAQPFAPLGLLGRALLTDAPFDGPPARSVDNEVVEPRQVLVLATAADLQALYKAIMNASAAVPARSGGALSLIA